MNSYRIDLRNFSVSGPVFDRDKLENISKNVVASMSAQEILDQLLPWAQEFNLPLYEAIQVDISYAFKVLNIGRGGKKPRKDIAKWADVYTELGYFWDVFFPSPSDGKMHLQTPDACEWIEKYALGYDASEDKETWFMRMKQTAESVGYAPDKQTFLSEPSRYRGTIGDAAAVLRQALTRRDTAPDLFDVMQTMGCDRVINRLKTASSNS